MPGTYLENVRLLAFHVDFAELLVYTWNDEVRDTLDAEWDEMRALLELTVHLPTDTLANAEAALRFFAHRDISRLTIHPVRDIPALRSVLMNGVEWLGDRLCLENLENDVFTDVMPAVCDIPCSVTMDYGHLLLTGAPVRRFLDQYGDRVREVHFHGFDGRCCHVAPDSATTATFLDLIDQWFPDNPGLPVCVETFEWGVTKAALRALAAHCPQGEGHRRDEHGTLTAWTSSV